jgi:hypothetical protein
MAGHVADIALLLTEGWVTLPSGTHIELDDNGEVVKGPPALRKMTPQGHRDEGSRLRADARKENDPAIRMDKQFRAKAHDQAAEHLDQASKLTGRDKAAHEREYRGMSAAAAGETAGPSDRQYSPVVAELVNGKRTGRYVPDTSVDVKSSPVPDHIEAKANIARRASEEAAKVKTGPDLEKAHEKARKASVEALDHLADHTRQNGYSARSDELMQELRSRVSDHNRYLEGQDWLKKNAARTYRLR